MGRRVKGINLILALVFSTGLIGSVYQGYQCWKIINVNHALLTGLPIADDSYAYQKKFAAAFHQGSVQDFKHAIQSYGQLLETPANMQSISQNQLSSIQFNIGNNLFLAGLSRGENEDGSLKEETKYSLSQAKVAYEQSLRLDSASRTAKFNLSLLHSVMPQSSKNVLKEQSGMELSNLPIGLP